jgi:cell division inhibitor SepF
MYREGKKMAVALVNKFLDALGLANDSEQETENEDIYELEDEKEKEEEVEERGIFGNRKSKITSMPQVQSVKMVITQPTSFEQSEEICNYLKDKKSIIINLEYVNKDVARRIIDFLSGAVHALNGHIQKISNSIFLVAPINYDIESDLAREELKNKLSVSWLK